jgi:hypothetical protein
VLVTNGKVQGIIGQVSEGSYMSEVQLRLSPKSERPKDLFPIFSNGSVGLRAKNRTVCCP